MNIVDSYDINKILVEIEGALQIDGKDYAEKDVSVILDNVHERIIRQYTLDLRDKKITDAELYIGKSRPSAVLFVDNLALLHAKLCGYLQIVRYIKHCTIRPVNINYMGFTPKSFTSFLIASINASTIPDTAVAMNAIRRKFGSINNCIEKKLILIMIICYELGLYEIVSAIAEILYIGATV